MRDLDVRIRLATGNDLGALRQALALAVDWRAATSEVDPRRIEETGHGYLLEDWGRAGDAAFVAEQGDLQGEMSIGAAWYRFWTENVHSYGFVDPRTPELGIGVHPRFQGRGVGSALLAHLLDHARDRGILAVSLSVERENPALVLYERFGFQPYAYVGGAVTMLKRLESLGTMEEAPVWKSFIAGLQATIEQSATALRQVPEEATAHRPLPGKWSPKEILGHLIDSATNNHQRFIRAQLQDDLIFPGYEQDAWVALQKYQEREWGDLIDLWRAYNLHIIRVMEAVPEEVRLRPRWPHNLHQIAWRLVPEEEAATLEYFMRDYVGHLKHHLAQILAPTELP